VIALFPPKKEYQPLSSDSTIFSRGGSRKTLPHWQKVSERKLDCEKVGHEVVDGRDTVKYKKQSRHPAAPLAAVSGSIPPSTLVAKWEDSSAAAELRKSTSKEKFVERTVSRFKGIRTDEARKRKPKGPRQVAWLPMPDAISVRSLTK